MRPPSLLLLPLLLLAGVLGCKRLDGDTLCEGTVVDRHTNARVANATVGVFGQGASGGGLGGGYVLLEEHQADASGNFAFQISDAPGQLLLRAATTQGYYTLWQEALYPRPGRNNKKLVLKAQAPAWVNIRFRDVAPLDSAFVRVWGSVHDAPGFYSWLFRDTSIIYPVMGNFTSTINWDAVIVRGDPNAAVRTGTQQVFCPGLDTTNIEVNY
jgi:hypothetical protein